VAATTGFGFSGWVWQPASAASAKEKNNFLTGKRRKKQLPKLEGGGGNLPGAARRTRIRSAKFFLANAFM